MWKWCRHAFAISEVEEVPFTNGRVIHCPWCDCPLLAKKLLEVGKFSGQLSRSANKRTCREIPSLAADDDFLPGETLENTLAEFDYPGREPRLPNPRTRMANCGKKIVR